jgi:hypothetical protein
LTIPNVFNSVGTNSPIKAFTLKCLAFVVHLCGMISPDTSAISSMAN